jgi:methionyl-tRNA formyltransferase
LIRGLSPYPAAWTALDGKFCKIFKTDISEENLSNVAFGNYNSDGKTFLKFQTGAGSLEILELQLEGKKRMKIGDFLRGYNF